MTTETQKMMAHSAQRISSDSGEDESEKPADAGIGIRMLKTRTILLAGQVDDKLAEKAIAQLLLMNADNHDPIRVIISTPGGHVDSGFAIADMLRFVESPIITLGAGWVASIGVPIYFAAPRESRYSLPNCRYLLHQPHGGAGGQATDIRIEAEEILKLRARINELVAAETGQDVEKVAKDSDRNFWMTAGEALEYGVVGKVIHSASEIS